MKTATLFLLLMALSSGMMRAQISEWRESNRTGVSKETGLLKIWPEAGPTLLWSNLELPKGYSGVSFGRNAMFVTGTKGSDDLLISLDLNGKILWQSVMGRAWTESFPDSRATPTVEGDKVYTCSGFGDIACFDANSGKIIWSYKASEENKGTYGAWGIAESLLLDGDKLYFSPGGPETMTLALDKQTGKVIWKSVTLNDKPSYVSPILVNYAGKKMIINSSQNYLYAADASNGDILWKVAYDKPADFKWELIDCVTPLYQDGKIYLTIGYDCGAYMVAMGSDGRSASVVWTDKVLDTHHGGVVLIDGYIYGSNWINNATGNWCCIEWATGKKMWEETWNCKGSIIAAEGLLYLYDEKNGNVGLVKANPQKFELISTFKANLGNSGPYWAHPVIHHGILYLRHTNALMAYDIQAK